MTLKSLALAAATLAMLSGAAIAQSSDVDQTKTNTVSPTGSTALEDKTLMTPFYTDDSMTTLRTGDEFNAAFNAMSSEDKERVRSECANSTSPREAFCESIKNIQ